MPVIRILVFAGVALGWVFTAAALVVWFGLGDPWGLGISAVLWVLGIARVRRSRAIRADRRACWAHREGVSPMFAADDDYLCMHGPNPCYERAHRLFQLEQEVLGSNPLAVVYFPTHPNAGGTADRSSGVS
jgi:hypothetical protein